MSAAGRRSPAAEAGQATLELLAGIPALALGALIALQLLVTGHALHLADGAAEAGALAVAAGEPAAPAVRAALPGWARGALTVTDDAGWVQVRLRPPAPTPAVGDALAVTARAWARPPAAGG